MLQLYCNFSTLLELKKYIYQTLIPNQNGFAEQLQESLFRTSALHPAWEKLSVNGTLADITLDPAAADLIVCGLTSAMSTRLST